MAYPIDEKERKRRFAEFALALSLLIGVFSLFSITFGLQRVRSTPRSQQENAGRVENTKVRPFFERENDSTNSGKYVLQRMEELNHVHSRSFLIGDLDTGEIIFERKSHTAYPIASITKYFTALTAVNYLKPNELVRVNQEGLRVPGNRAHLKKDDTLTVRELLYPLLLVSSNDAAELIARQRNRLWFVNRMNALAKNYGLTNTHFEDPTGLSRYNVSSAHDLFQMMREAWKRYPQLVRISSLNEVGINGYHWRNINRAHTFSGFFGGKTGYTDTARHTSIGYYHVKLANDQERNIAIVILQSDTRESDTQKILNYLRKHVSYIPA